MRRPWKRTSRAAALGTLPERYCVPAGFSRSPSAGAGLATASFTKTQLGSRRYARVSFAASFASTASCRPAPTISARPSRKIAVSANSSATSWRSLRHASKASANSPLSRQSSKETSVVLKPLASLVPPGALLRRPEVHSVPCNRPRWLYASVFGMAAAAFFRAAEPTTEARVRPPRPSRDAWHTNRCGGSAVSRRVRAGW